MIKFLNEVMIPILQILAWPLELSGLILIFLVIAFPVMANEIEEKIYNSKELFLSQPSEIFLSWTILMILPGYFALLIVRVVFESIAVVLMVAIIITMIYFFFYSMRHFLKCIRNLFKANAIGIFGALIAFLGLIFDSYEFFNIILSFDRNILLIIIIVITMTAMISLVSFLFYFLSQRLSKSPDSAPPTNGNEI